jgi:hypothetical protein
MNPSKSFKPKLSRSGTTGSFGKLTAELPKMRLSEDTLEGLRRLSHDEDLPLAEYVRTLLDVHVHGEQHVATVAAQRVLRVVRKASSNGGGL